jgi:hypothetical protein
VKLKQQDTFAKNNQEVNRINPQADPFSTGNSQKKRPTAANFRSSPAKGHKKKILSERR